MEQTRSLFCTCNSGAARYHNTSVTSGESLKIDVRSVLHGQVRLAAANQIHVTHEAMNGSRNTKIH